MQVDADSALDGFLSQSADVRRRAAEAFERWRLRDPGGLSLSLAMRAAAAGEVQGRQLSAVLLRKVLLKSKLELAGKQECAPWCQPGLGEVLLEALRSAVYIPEVRSAAADAVATAALIQFGKGWSWPEFLSMLAGLSSGGREERSIALRILEQLFDDSDASLESGAETPAVFAGLIPLLTEHGNALFSLLEVALRDSGDETSRDSAARIYVHCVVGAAAPAPLREALGDLAAVLAEAAATPAVSSTAPAGESGPSGQDALSEACLQAAALATRADPAAWGLIALAGSSAEASLPITLLSTVSNVSITFELRAAALAALVELTVAAHLAASCGAAPDSSRAIADQLAERAATVTAALLAELPDDETTEEWAEAVTNETDPDGSHTEGLLDAALDAAERLANLPRCSGAGLGGGVLGLEARAKEMLRREAWQPHHAALLIYLRLAFISEGAVPDGAVAMAAATALQHFSHTHPRVRWAALEVWARLLAKDQDGQVNVCAISQQDFAQSFETLTAIINSDPYIRVRHHGLLVFVAAATAAVSPLASAQLKPLFHNVLIPQVASSDAAVREACVTIARSFTVTSGEQHAAQKIAGAEVVASLWREFCEAASAGEQLNTQIELEGQDVQIEWPADWKFKLNGLD